MFGPPASDLYTQPIRTASQLSAPLLGEPARPRLPSWASAALLLASTVLIACTALLSDTSAEPLATTATVAAASEPLRVLFIGNSFTYGPAPVSYTHLTLPTKA